MIAQLPTPSPAMFYGVVSVLVMLLAVAVLITTLLRNLKPKEKSRVRVKNGEKPDIVMARMEDLQSLRKDFEVKIEAVNKTIHDEFEEWARYVERRRAEVDKRLDQQQTQHNDLALRLTQQVGELHGELRARRSRNELK